METWQELRRERESLWLICYGAQTEENIAASLTLHVQYFGNIILELVVEEI